MSKSTVLTLGYGSFGAKKFLPTLGYGTSGVAVARDTHDGFDDIEDDTPKRLEEYRRRKDELREQISRNFEALTGEAEVPVVSEVQKLEEKKLSPPEKRILKDLKNDLEELNQLNVSLANLAKLLQEREMQDIAFIVSIL